MLDSKFADAIARPAAIIAAVLVSVTLVAVLAPCAIRRLGAAPRRPMLGTLLILAVVVLWTGSSVAVQLVFESAHYRKPFFLTYFTTSMLMLYLPFYPKRLAQLLDLVTGRSVRYELVREGGATTRPGDETSRAALAPGGELGIALRLAVPFFAYQLCFVISLELSTVSSVTVISASSGLWTLLFSAALLGERVGPVKLASTLLSFGGVLIVVRLGSVPGGAASSGLSPAWGNAAALLSALLYGGYAALLKRDCPDESVVPIPYLFGLIGLLTAVFCAAAIPVLHLMRIERFAPPSGTTLIALLCNALFGSVISNVLLARAMLLASPLVATVGLSLTIPLAIASDVMRSRGRFSKGLLLGTVAVWCGFIGVSTSETLEKRCTKAWGRWRAGPRQRTADAPLERVSRNI